MSIRDDEQSAVDARVNYIGSLKSHNHQPKHFSLPVTLESSDNGYLTYPVKGVIQAIEQGMNLTLVHAVFQVLNDDGTLSAKVVVKNPVFTYGVK